MLPAKVNRVWSVDVHGTAVAQTPPIKKLSSGQRHYLYRLGLLAVDKFMKEHGFRPNALDSQTSLSYEHKRVYIDISLKKPANVAYVTSHSGYSYKQQVVGETPSGQKIYKINARVVYASDIIGSDLMIQVMVGDKYGTRNPVFIPLPKDLEKPAHYVLQNVLAALAAACEHNPDIRDAFTEESVAPVVEGNIELDLPTDFIPLSEAL